MAKSVSHSMKSIATWSDMEAKEVCSFNTREKYVFHKLIKNSLTKEVKADSFF